MTKKNYTRHTVTYYMNQVYRERKYNEKPPIVESKMNVNNLCKLRVVGRKMYFHCFIRAEGVLLLLQ